MKSARPDAKARLLICATCQEDQDRNAIRKALGEALAALNLREAVDVRFGGCMNVCREPVALGLQGQGRASYIFGGINLVSDAADIAATCESYLRESQGWIVEAEVCGRLRYCLRARLPALR